MLFNFNWRAFNRHVINQRAFAQRVVQSKTAVHARLISNAIYPLICSGVLCGLFSSASFAATSAVEPASTATATNTLDPLQQLLDKVSAYQASQLGWQTQQQIVNAQRQQSALWANPSLSIEQTGLQRGQGSNQDQELAMGISLPLDIFGQRQAAMNLAKLSVAQLDLAQQRYHAELKLIVQYAWSQVALLQSEQSLMAQQVQVSQDNLDATLKRYQAGSIAQVDVERVRVAHLENQRMAQDADLQLQLAKQQLARLWGGTLNTVEITPSINELWSRIRAIKNEPAASNNVVAQSLQLETQRQQATITQLKAQARPQPIVTLGLKQTRSVDQATNNQMRVGVEIPLNIFNPQKYGVQIAAAKQRLIEQQQQVYRQQNQININIALAELRGLDAQFQQLNAQQLPLASQVQQKTLQGFRLGKFALSEVQQATTQLQAVRMRQVQLLKQAWQVALSLQSARTGLMLEQITAKDALIQLNQRVWQQTSAVPSRVGE